MADHKFWVDYFELKNGRIKVFRRKNVSTKFCARFTFHDRPGYVQESLKTSDKDEATSVAMEKYLQYEFRKKQGLAVKTKPFITVANDECRDYLQRVRERMTLMAKKYGFKHDEKNGYVFTDYRGQKVGSFKKCFNAWLANAGVCEDKDGNKRCLGPLRIFYATMRLLKGESLDLYDLAL